MLRLGRNSGETGKGDRQLRASRQMPRRRGLAALPFVVALVLAAPLLAPASAAAAGTGSIEGTAKFGPTGVEHLEVCAEQIAESPKLECKDTTAGGAYVIAGLPESEYHVTFTGYVCPSKSEHCAHEYMTQRYNNKLFPEGNPVKVEGGKTAGEINATLKKGGTVSGTVVSRDPGTPVENIEVCAHEGSFTENFELFIETIACGFTNSSGAYSLGGLRNGSSFIVGLLSGDVCGPSEESQCSPFYGAAWYNGAAEEGTATKLKVTEAEPKSGVELLLTPLAPVNRERPKISGSATPGATLHCSEGVWEPGVSEGSIQGYEYAWLRNGTAIPGQVGSSYTVATGDEGQALACVVTASNQYLKESATSNAVVVPRATISTTTTTTSSTATGTAVAAAKAQVKGGKAAVAITCQGAGACKGTLTLTVSVTQTRVVKRHGKPHKVKSTRKLVIGSASFSLAAGGKVTLSIGLTGQGPHLLSKAGRGGLAVQVGGSDVRSGRLVLQLVPTRKAGAKRK